ncbi:MAG: YdcF family protein [Candidatus Margulisiibacteriota bacterium]
MRNKLFWLFLLVVILIGSYFSYPFILMGMANYLIVQDEIKPADVIVVLGGDNNGERVEEGVKLFKRGYAPYLLMSGGPLAWKLTQAQWMKKQAVESGIPPKFILIQEKSRSTIEDAKFCLPILMEHNFKSVILVTSPYHTRRARRVFQKICAPQGIKVLVYPAQKSDFNPVGWWRKHEDTAYVVWEYVAFVLYLLKGY